MLNYLRFLLGKRHRPLRRSRYRFSRDRSHLLENARTVALVGNGPASPSMRAAIDQADIVIRFNLAPNSAATGTRTDAHVLMNHDQPRFARPAHLLNPDVFCSAREIWLPIDPEIMNAIERRDPSRGPSLLNWTHSICARHGDKKKLFVIPAHIHAEACRLVSPHLPGATVIEPSSGFLAIVYSFWCNPAVTLHLFGFTHQGWDGHPWEAERQAVDQYVAAGRILRHSMS